MLLQIRSQFFLNQVADQCANGGVTQLRLGLTLKLGILQLDADDGGETLAAIFTLQIGVTFFQQAELAGIGV